MGALIKLAAFSTPVILLGLFLAFFLNREHVADQRVDEAAFDREFASEMSGFHEKRGNKKLTAMYDSKAAAAQKEYSSAKAEQIEARKKVSAHGNKFETTMEDLSTDLDAEIKRGGL